MIATSLISQRVSFILFFPSVLYLILFIPPCAWVSETLLYIVLSKASRFVFIGRYYDFLLYTLNVYYYDMVQ